MFWELWYTLKLKSVCKRTPPPTQGGKESEIYPGSSVAIPRHFGVDPGPDPDPRLSLMDPDSDRDPDPDTNLGSGPRRSHH
jgi:hypothetical protein